MTVDMKNRYPLVSAFPNISCPDYKTAISEGRFEGYTLLNKFAYTESISPGVFKVLSNNLDIIHFISSEQQMQIIATSAEDCITGTGVRAILINYLNEALEVKSECLELAVGGVTQTVATDIYRIESIASIRYGSAGSLSGATDILQIKNLAGTELYGEISQYSTTSESCIHWIRPGYRTIFSEIKVESTSDKGVFVGIFATFDYSACGGDDSVTTQCCGIEIGGGSVAIVALDPHVGFYNASSVLQCCYLGVTSRSGIPNLQGSGSFVVYEYLNDY